MRRQRKSEAVQLAEMADRAQLRSQLIDLLGKPAVLRMGVLAGTLIGTRLLRDSWGKDNMGARDICAGLAALGTVLLAADAGITDWKALGAVSVAAGTAVGSGKGGVIALGRGAWGSGALIEVDPFQVSSIWSGLTGD